MQYFIRINNQVIGPMQPHQLLAYGVDPNTAVSTDGINWTPLYTDPVLMQVYQQNNTRAVDSEVNSKKTLCGIMAMLFGWLGVQYFILGKVAGGFITILLTLVTCGAWEVVTFIQGIVMLCMPESEFKRKFMDSTSTLPLF